MAKAIRNYELKRTLEGNFEIGFEGGGILPNALRGMWTSEGAAKKAIAAYREAVGDIAERKIVSPSDVVETETEIAPLIGA